MRNLRFDAEIPEFGFRDGKARVCRGVRDSGSLPKQREPWVVPGASASVIAFWAGPLCQEKTSSAQRPLSCPLGTAKFLVSGVAQDEARPCGFPSGFPRHLTSSPLGFSLQDADSFVLVPDTLPCA